MATLISKDKQISKQRQDFVEHNFEAMVGARKRRYNETPQQKQRTEFLEDYYLLYTRNKNKWQKLKEWLKNQITDLRHIEIKTKTQSLRVNDAVNCYRQVLSQMQELEGEDE